MTVQDLRHENKDLREKLAELQRQNAELRAQLDGKKDKGHEPPPGGAPKKKLDEPARHG